MFGFPVLSIIESGNVAFEKQLKMIVSPTFPCSSEENDHSH